MSAQILAFDIAGKNNERLELSASRIMQGATWKKQRIVVLLPASDTISTKVALSHWCIIFPPNQPVHRMLCLGMEVGEAYSSGVEAVLGHPELSQWEFLLTLEHDNMPPQDGVLILIEAMEKHPEFAAVSGL